ncbi:tetratricopeptide repeat protein [Nitrospina watsonii]|uniref:Enzyme n=1 Tax=Nitrospina watsonii TaxID=1323948 RepID=A0ABN8VVP6_9BACT|nr:tetratricopeptide repeat protein [Nitrospina watsonii]CAI2716909.1 putative enzyme [Nitrospina watsonii]
MIQGGIKQHLQSFLLLGVLGMAAWAVTLTSPFLHEDPHFILDDPRTASLSQGWQALELKNLLQQPVLFFSYAVNRALGGDDALGFHLVNILIHVAAALLFYLLLVECSGRTRDRPKAEWTPLPALAAALYLVHPLNVQAVTYLSDRGHLLATLFYLAAMLGVARFARLRQEQPKSFRGPAWMLLAAACFLLALGAHAAAVTLPVMAIVYLILFGNDPSLKKELKISLAVLIPILLYMAWRVPLDDPRLPGTGDAAALDRWRYLATQVEAWWFFYGWKYVLPFQLNFQPEFAPGGLSDPGLWGALVLTATAAYLAWKKTDSPLLRFGLIWTLVTLLPTSSLVPLDPVVSESRFYLPGLGLHLFAAWGLIRLTRERPRRTLTVAGGLVIGGLLMLTVVRGTVFQSEERLWQDVLAQAPGQPQATLHLASFYENANQPDNAERALKAALALHPEHESLRLRLGLLYMEQKRLEPAIEQFEAAIHEGTQNPVAFYNAGRALVEQQQGAKAAPFLERVIQGEKLPGKYYFLLGRAYHQAGRLDDALKQFRLVVKKEPGNAEALNKMGEVYWDMKSFFFADVAFQQAYQVDDRSLPILNNLISSSMLMQHYEDAIEYCDRLLEIDPDNANARQWKIAAQRFQKTKKSEPPPPGLEIPAP